MQGVVVFCACIAGFFFSVPTSAQTPSFDCATNFAPDEITICRNGTLSSLDRQMAVLYFAVWSSLDARQQTTLRSDQRSWLKQRSSCITNQACLMKAYQDRISHLTGLQSSVSPSSAPSAPSKPTPGGGSGDACDMFPMLCR